MKSYICHIPDRNIFRYCLIIWAVLWCCTSCVANGNSGTGQTPEPTPRDTASYTLPLPEIPASLKTPEERAAFLSRHYWDEMDWNDTLLLSSERFMGESMATFGTLLSITPRDKAVSAISGMVSAAACSVPGINAVNDYAYDYLYYPDSPQYDPELYLLFINALSAQPGLDMASRARLDDRKAQIMKNRVGDRASDFDYIGTDGRTHSLLSTRKDAPVRILMLYDPDCTVCEEAVKIMRENAGFTVAQAEGDVAVIAINAFGQEDSGPARVKAGFPSLWTVGYSPDGAIDAEELYVIRATPAIYVLDSEGRILEKDLSLARLAELVASR